MAKKVRSEYIDEASGKIKSVLALAKYKAGDELYWVTSFPIVNVSNIKDVEEDDEWAFDADIHPKVLYKYKILNTWPSKDQLPKLHACDFRLLVDLLEIDLVVRPFPVSAVIRCPDTSEFIYCNTTGEEWMCEGDLFSTSVAAERERIRIMHLIEKWIQRQLRQKP